MSEGIPIVPVDIIAKETYDFDKAKDCLETLTEETLDRANPAAPKQTNFINLSVKDIGKII